MMWQYLLFASILDDFAAWIFQDTSYDSHGAELLSKEEISFYVGFDSWNRYEVHILDLNFFGFAPPS
jgi:NADPH-dependent 7-cyano-7-deazaguanine reductase QueF-like protein